MTVDRAYEALRKHPDLPSPRGIALEVMRLAASSTCNLNDLADVVQADPAIVSRLLRVVNSSAYPHARPIVSTVDAISYLGTRMVGCIALSFSLVAENTRCNAFDYVQFWSSSVARAVAGNKLAWVLRAYIPDEVFTLCLLSQVGRLALAVTQPDEYDTLLSAIDCTGNELAEFETELFGIDHNELAARLLADWGLPAVACEAVRLQDAPAVDDSPLTTDPDRLAAVIHLSGLFADQLTAGPERSPGLWAFGGYAARLGLPAETVGETLAAVIPQWQEMLLLFDVRQLTDQQLQAIYVQAAALREQLQSDETVRRSAC